MKEERKIILYDETITYELKRYKRQKRINMIIHQDGTFIVTAPRTCPLYEIDRALTKNATWLVAKMNTTQMQKSVTIDARVVALIKKDLRVIIEARLQHFNAHYGFVYARISLRRQRSRWGSCSSAGNLNFNIRLAGLPEELRDYVIVHELCHIAQMNHGPAFWALVAETIPQYKVYRKALRLQ